MSTQEQSFLRYVLSDVAFIASSTLACARSLLVPATLVGAGVSVVAAPPAGLLVLAAMAIFVALDWVCLVCRMARRIAMGTEEPNDLLDRSVLANAAYLHAAYYTPAGRARRLAT